LCGCGSWSISRGRDGGAGRCRCSAGRLGRRGGWRAGRGRCGGRRGGGGGGHLWSVAVRRAAGGAFAVEGVAERGGVDEDLLRAAAVEEGDSAAGSVGAVVVQVQEEGGLAGVAG